MYENRFTRANPGLIVIMIDQSGSMNDQWTGGKSLADHTALVINRCLSEMIARFTDINEGVKPSAHVVLIGYGGIRSSDKAYIISDANIVEMQSSYLKIETVQKKMSDGAGGLIETEIEMPIWVEPVAVWGTPMADAFRIAHDVIEGWANKTQQVSANPDAQKGKPEDNPVPIIINVSDGAPTDSEQDLRTHADKIKSISCPDGSPLIFNVHLSPNSGLEVLFPKSKSNLPSNDSMSELLYDISSDLPDAFVPDAIKGGFNVSGGERTFISNVATVESFIAFLNFGTNGGGAKGEGIDTNR